MGRDFLGSAEFGELFGKNYDGSWTEWGNMVAVPIEKDV